MTGVETCPRAVCPCPRPGRDPDGCVEARAGADLLAADFAALHDRHLVNFLKYLELRGLSSHDAEDVAADAFATLYQRLDVLRTADEPAAFAFTVLHAKLVDHWRKRDRRPRIAGPPDVDQPAPDEVAGLVVRLDLQRVLARLPEQQAKCVALRVFLGRETKDIGRYLGITASAVRSHLSSARERLRSELGIEIGWEEAP